MATYRKRGKAWRAEIRLRGIKQSASFPTKAAAIAWATEQEAAIRAGKTIAHNVPFSDLLDRYKNEVTPKKKGVTWESNRLEYYKRHWLGDVMLPDLKPPLFAKWRDERLKEVKGSTVNRDWNLLSNVCAVAVNEWHWLPENPMSKIKRPADEPARDYLITEQDIDDVLHSSGYDYDDPIETLYQRVAATFLFAIETAMRAGEIASLTRDQVDFDKRVARLLKTKNGDKRNVPLSSEAIRIIKQLPESDTLFDLTSMQISSNFNDIKKRAMRDEFTFHDTRHLAITRLSKLLDIRELARMTGHRDINELMTYYNKPAEETAKLLP